MKTRNIFTLLISVGLLLAGCSNKKEKGSILSPIQNTVKVEWTAYKTTDKIPVKGDFKVVVLENIGTGSTIDSILNQAEFSIDAFGFSTGDPSRDEKIKNSFFGLMTEPGSISGKFLIKDNQWYVKLKMNGITIEKLPASITYKNNILTLSTSIDLRDFKALNALETLNKICYDLHKGADGISKTWEVVDVLATIEFEEN